MKSVLVVLLLCMAVPASAQSLNLSKLYADGAVVQRDVALPVFGHALPGAAVEVTLAGMRAEATADASGRWVAQLPALPAGGPHTMTVVSGEESLTVTDVHAGDVWLASGQSNMEWTVASSANAAAEVSAANDPMIRHFKVPRSWAYTPADTLAGGAWDAASPETVGQFSGVGYAFAQHLRAMLEDDVAIGIVNSTWGGSRIEPWMSAAALGTTPEEAEAAEKARVNARLAGLRDLLGELPAEDAGLVDGAALWADPAYDDSSWGTIELGANWESAGYPDLDGVAWYRTTFELTEEQADLPAFVILGMIDDSDQAWINGVSIGSTDMAYNRERRYRVRPSALRPGRNVLAIRVEDFGGGGGINATGNPLSFQSPSGSLLLDGPWRFKVARVDADFSFDKNQIPTLLYNAMIAPLQPFPVRGVIWYQGESNAGTVDDAKAYEDLFAGLIQNWRSDWASPELPFFWAQLAAYHEEDTEPPAESPWATHRASQTAALELPATGQAILTDLGDARDIHPRNKKDVGIRLAQTALNVAYGREDVPRSGPTYAGYELNESRVTVTFDHVGEALMSSGDAVEGFALQSEDGTWAWASAEITGPNTVSVYAASIPAPVGLRFAWADNPSRANLYASNDRPAVPFQIGDLTNRGSSP